MRLSRMPAPCSLRSRKKQKFVAKMQPFVFVAWRKIDRDVVAQFGLTHFLRETAAFEGTIFEVPSRRNELGAIDTVRARIKFASFGCFAAQDRESFGIAVVQNLDNFGFLVG